MICKYCNAEIEENADFCPICGKSLTEEIAAEETVAEETVVEETAAEETAEETVAEEIVEASAQPKKKRWPVVLAIAAAVVAVAALAVVLMIALDLDLKPRANDLFYKGVYTVEDEEAVKKADRVVATVGGKELTNAQLQIYFNMQVADFTNYYGGYLSYIGLDMTKPLSEQTCALDETMNWEQYFIKVSIETWQNYQTMGLLAEQAGFALDAEIEDQLTKLPESLDEQATQGGFENAEAMVKAYLGEACTLEDYMEYIRLMYLSNQYYGAEYERLTPNEEEIAAYFTEHEAELKESGVTKESGLVSDVRHILVMFEGGTKNEETGETTYSEEEKATALAEAEKILNEWKSGEATEASFGELANKYTDDPGSSTTGGLYQGIAPGSNYYEGFLDWAVDGSRQVGETGIVETHAGYHIMYFVTGEPYWINSCRTALASERTTALIEEAEQNWPIKINYKKIALSELDFG